MTKRQNISRKGACTAAKIFTRKNLIVQEVGLKEEKQAVVNHLDAVIGDMPEGEVVNFRHLPSRKPEGFLSSGKVQYVAKAGNFVKHGFKFTGALRVMETILRYEYLWKSPSSWAVPTEPLHGQPTGMPFLFYHVEPLLNTEGL